MTAESASIIALPAVSALTDTGLLDDALRQARALAVLHRLAQDQPSARRFAAALAGWLTDALPNRWETESLLLTCIRQGKRAVTARRAADEQALSAWLHGLCQPLPSLLDWRVEHADSGHVWEPLGNEPLLLWRQRGSGRLTVTRWPPAQRPIVTPDTVRLILIGHLLDPQGLTAIGGHLPLLLENSDG